MQLRKYEKNDCAKMAELFFETVHTINARDYTKEQLDAWATGNVDIDTWNRLFLEHDTLVAIENGQIVGFGDMDETGYLDKLYVHKDFQGMGIATRICDELEEKSAARQFITHASITAKPFYEKRGYRVVKKQEVERFGVSMSNYVMEKLRDKE